MSYDNDRKDGEWALRDYVRKGIEVLDNKTGFFMMVEGGKVDWVCHANDRLTIGYAGTDYNLFFRTLDGQKISYAKFDSDYVSAYMKNGTCFEC